MYLPPYIRDIHGTAFPPTPVERELFYRDDLHQLFYWNGVAWITAGPGMVVHDNTWHAPPFATEAALVAEAAARVAADAAEAAARAAADAAHAALTTLGIHGSAVLATPNRLIHRDAAGRSQIANPAVNADIDNLGARNAAIAAHAALTVTHGATGAIVGTTNTQELTNKTLYDKSNEQEYIHTWPSTSTPIPVGEFLRNFYSITALAVDAYFAAPIGTPANANRLIIRIKDNGTARALTWSSVYRRMEFALPTTTVAGKTMYLGFIYNSADSKWDMVAINEQA